jgi:hypothetical protein
MFPILTLPNHPLLHGRYQLGRPEASKLPSCMTTPHIVKTRSCHPKTPIWYILPFRPSSGRSQACFLIIGVETLMVGFDHVATLLFWDWGEIIVPNLIIGNDGDN